MKVKKNLRIVVDSLMLLLFIAEMSERGGQNHSHHALWGIVLFVFFILHNVINFSFYKSIFKGRYNGRRIFTATVDLLLCVFMILLVVSSLMISGMALDFSPFHEFSWIGIHKFSASWSFVIMAMHLGLHLNGMLNKIELVAVRPVAKWSVVVGEVMVFASSVFFFTQSRLWSAMVFYRRRVKVPDTFVFCLEYLLIVAGFCVLVHWIFKVRSLANENRISFKG